MRIWLRARKIAGGLPRRSSRSGESVPRRARRCAPAFWVATYVALAVPRSGGVGAARRWHTDLVLILTDSGAAALMLAIVCGAIALVVQASWQAEHDCGNRYCRHVKRGDDSDSQRP